ncbi:MAG: carbamoyl phosphate synthase small subunit [SAR202 cluster bacterium Io17-Chloro-G9]|nr:MAG: carbamoyl phosphate synthase small subunit [SAR202 cluster bacterium Io17-Chloro-G9]
MPDNTSDIKPAFLVLEDGSVYPGDAFGAQAGGHGEVVFNTSMTGYQEVLTDPSYAGQLVTLTYPLVGNYGINEEDFESRHIQVAGLIVREHCESPSHGRSRKTLHQYLESQEIPGICGVDTRAITRRLRSHGVMTGVITSESPDEGRAQLANLPRYDDIDFVRTVTTTGQYQWDTPPLDPGAPVPRIIVMDCGLKYNILRLLRERGCQVIAVPAATSAEDMLDLDPSGILLSPGPGDPQLLNYLVENVRRLAGRIPIMGICLGHQIVARALGAGTYKLKFGHRGGNHPVKDLDTGRVYITAQNHGYAVSADSLPQGLEVTHVNLNDDTVEGLRHRDMPIFTIQYHSEGSPGPRDNEYLFDRFLAMVEEARGQTLPREGLPIR